MKIEWIESFALRVPEIDGEHRTMLELMKLVERSASSSDQQRVGRYLDRLIDFSRGHFAREEALLSRWGYPEVEEHASYHAELLERAETVLRSCADAETPTAFRDCCEEMISFLVDDVVRGDMQLKSFLEHAGLSVPH